MKIIPRTNNLLITLHDVPADSSIIKPDTATPTLPHGKVIAVGPDVKATQLGDLILASPDSLMGFRLPTGDVYLVPEHAVIANLDLDNIVSLS